MKVPNADLNLSKAFVTDSALKSWCRIRANSPLQVKSMLERRRFRGAKREKNV
jgi:hypothetical protein